MNKFVCDLIFDYVSDVYDELKVDCEKMTSYLTEEAIYKLEKFKNFTVAGKNNSIIILSGENCSRTISVLLKDKDYSLTINSLNSKKIKMLSNGTEQIVANLHISDRKKAQDKDMKISLTNKDKSFVLNRECIVYDAVTCEEIKRTAKEPIEMDLEQVKGIFEIEEKGISV